MLVKDRDGNWYDPESKRKFGKDSKKILAEMARQQAEMVKIIPGVLFEGPYAGAVLEPVEKITITTDMIPTDTTYFNAFGSIEREASALWVIKFLKSRGHFGPFTFEEWDDWCQANGHKGGTALLNGLDYDHCDHRFIVKIGDKLHVTLRFLAICLERGLQARNAHLR